MEEPCIHCNGTGERQPDGVDEMGLPRWGPEGLDNKVDKSCTYCKKDTPQMTSPIETPKAGETYKDADGRKLEITAPRRARANCSMTDKEKILI
jgi:hypothetical protein